MNHALIFLATLSVTLAAQDGQSKYKDNPTQLTTSEAATKAEIAIAPYITKAKSTFSNVKERYLKGLPVGSVLFITYRLKDDKRFEIVFTQVMKIEGHVVSAKIANDLNIVKNYSKGQVIQFDESDLVDWTIVDKDGEEEGNVVGKFLDTYKP